MGRRFSRLPLHFALVHLGADVERDAKAGLRVGLLHGVDELGRRFGLAGFGVKALQVLAGEANGAGIQRRAGGHVAGDDDKGLEGFDFVELGEPGLAFAGLLGVGSPYMQVVENGDVAGDGLDRRNPHVGAMCQFAGGAAYFDGFAIHAQRGALQQLGHDGVVRGIGPHLRCPEGELAGQLGLDLVAHGRGGQHLGLRKEALQHFGAKVEVGVGVADEDGFQGFAAIEHVGGNPQGVGAGKARVDDDGFVFAADEHGIDMEAVAVGVVVFDGQRGCGVCAGGSNNAQAHQGGKDVAGQFAGAGHGVVSSKG
jgi:hypothetical protein